LKLENFNNNVKELQNKTPIGFKKRDLNISIAKTKATEKQWILVDIAIKEFIRQYPLHWIRFINTLKKDVGNRNEFGLANKKYGKNIINRRHTASFPVIVNNKGEIVDGLLPVLEKFIPQLTHKNSVNYYSFLKKYPMFKAASKV